MRSSPRAVRLPLTVRAPVALPHCTWHPIQTREGRIYSLNQKFEIVDSYFLAKRSWRQRGPSAEGRRRRPSAPRLSETAATRVPQGCLIAVAEPSAANPIHSLERREATSRVRGSGQRSSSASRSGATPGGVSRASLSSQGNSLPESPSLRPAHLSHRSQYAACLDAARFRRREPNDAGWHSRWVAVGRHARQFAVGALGLHTTQSAAQ